MGRGKKLVCFKFCRLFCQQLCFCQRDRDNSLSFPDVPTECKASADVLCLPHMRLDSTPGPGMENTPELFPPGGLLSAALFGEYFTAEAFPVKTDNGALQPLCCLCRAGGTVTASSNQLSPATYPSLGAPAVSSGYQVTPTWNSADP